MTMNTKRVSVFAAVLGLAAFGSGANAATTTTTFQVSANVIKACSVSANNLSFGDYDPTSSTPLDVTTTITVLCTLGTSFSVGLDEGDGSGASVTSRLMTNGGSTLNYGLYQNAGRSTNWGNSVGSDTPAAQNALALGNDLTVYGRVPEGQNVAQGTYTDDVTVTVTY